MSLTEREFEHFHADKMLADFAPELNSSWNRSRINFHQHYIYSTSMNSYLFVTIVFSLLTTARSAATFCSIVCSLKNCANGNPTPNGCTTCNSNWVKSGATCVPDAAKNFYLFDNTSDLGGGLVVVPDNKAVSVCSYTLFGTERVSNSFRVKSASGISVSFFQIIVYFGTLTIDVGVTSNSKWNYFNTFFFLNFTSGDGFTQTNNYPLMGPTYSIKEILCYTNSISEHWNKFSQSYNFNTSNTSLSFTISNNQTNTSNEWAIKEFIIIYKGCHNLCKTCFGSSNTQCYSCNYNATTNSSWLSGTTCNAACAAGYGYTTNASFCIQCDPLCTSCYNTSTFCMNCALNGPNTAYFYSTNSSCLKVCPNLTYANTSTQNCEPCNTSCLVCLYTANFCTSCKSGTYIYNNVCYNQCPDGTYLQADNISCANCSLLCTKCSSAILCSVCQTVAPYIAYLYNTTSPNGTCVYSCPKGTYAENFNSTGPNLCLACNSSCTSCAIDAYNCQQCSPGYYLLGPTCYFTCPGELFPSNATGFGLCLDCNLVCVDLTILMYFSNAVNNQMYIDMLFTQNLNYSSFDYINFQTITIDSGNLHYTLDMFNVTYKKLSGSSYRIILKPSGYIFLYNATFTVTTRSQPSTIDQSLILLPFKDSNYLKTASLNWFLIQGPPFSPLQLNIMSSFATLSQKTNNFLDLPVVQQIKKSGLFMMLFSGAQITSCSVLSNQIQSQNLYEGVRFWAIFVFFDVPPYEQISNQTKNFFVPSVESRIRNAPTSDEYFQQQVDGRKLFSTDVMYWRFQRTGQTSFFIYDCYIPVILIILCWITLLIVYKMQKTRWFARHAAKVYSAVHKVHEISLMYITMASIVEFTYFETTSLERYVSAGVCLLFNVYFVAYELYIYYDMLNYPLTEIGNNLYEYYVTRYGCFLKNIRYQEYYIHERWSPKHWFRPYNFHFLSYYKKFVMMIALPLFYSTQYAQMSILLIIQLLQLLRVWFVWPFVSKSRNYLRVSLEIALALFFIANIIQIYLLNKVQSSDISKMGQTIRMYYGLGWAGFCLCFYFNLTHLIICIYDFITGLRSSSRAKMDIARRKYYYAKIKEYERDNEGASKQLVRKWVKLGNLHEQIFGQLPQINVRIQQYALRMSLNKFEVSVRKITELKLMSSRNYRKKNNTNTTRKLEKRGVLYQHKSPQLYRALHEQFSKYANHHIEIVVIKTFLNVFQPDFKPGQQIPFDRNKMFQKIELISYNNQKEEHKEEELIEGFPLPLGWFENF